MRCHSRGPHLRLFRKRIRGMEGASPARNEVVSQPPAAHRVSQEESKLLGRRSSGGMPRLNTRVSVSLQCRTYQGLSRAAVSRVPSAEEHGAREASRVASCRAVYLLGQSSALEAQLSGLGPRGAERVGEASRSSVFRGQSCTDLAGRAFAWSLHFKHCPRARACATLAHRPHLEEESHRTRPSSMGQSP